MKQFIKDASAGLLALIAVFVIGLFLVIGMGIAAVYGHGWFVDHTADRSGRTQVKQQINGNGGYRIAAYDHFYDLCADVQTDESNISNTQSELKVTTDQGRKLQLLTNLGAQRNKRAGDINQYNADARKSATLGQFKASDLPYQLNLNEETTTCHA